MKFTKIFYLQRTVLNSTSTLKLFFSIVFILLTLASAAQSSSHVIDKYLDAIGGQEKWNAIETKTEEGIFINAPPENKWVLETKKRDTLKVIIKYKRHSKLYYKSSQEENSMSSIMCYNGKIFWTQRAGGDVSIQSREYGEYFLQSGMIGFADVLLEKTSEVEFMGVEKLQAKEYNILKVKREGWKLPSKFYFELESGLRYCTMALGAATERYTVFKDYRKIDGVFFHFVEEGYDKHWNLESKTITERIQINVPLADEEFSVPNSN